MSRLGRIFTSCVSKSKTIDNDVVNGKPKNHEDKQELPEVEELEYYERVQRDAVAVEFIDHTKDKIVGYISVRNDSPDKKVVVRYTKDGWHTYEEITSEWLESIDSQNCDKFRFSILDLETPYTIHLAVRFEVLGQHYWDNNNDKNYEVAQ